MNLLDISGDIYKRLLSEKLLEHIESDSNFKELIPKEKLLVRDAFIGGGLATISIFQEDIKKWISEYEKKYK